MLLLMLLLLLMQLTVLLFAEYIAEMTTAVCSAAAEAQPAFVARVIESFEVLCHGINTSAAAGVVIDVDAVFTPDVLGRILAVVAKFPEQ